MLTALVFDRKFGCLAIATAVAEVRPVLDDFVDAGAPAGRTAAAQASRRLGVHQTASNKRVDSNILEI